MTKLEQALQEHEAWLRYIPNLHSEEDIKRALSSFKIGWQTHELYALKESVNITIHDQVNNIPVTIHDYMTHKKVA